MAAESGFAEWLTEQAKQAVLEIRPIDQIKENFELYQNLRADERSFAFAEVLEKFDLEAYVDFFLWRLKRHSPEIDEAQMKTAILEQYKAGYGRSRHMEKERPRFLSGLESMACEIMASWDQNEADRAELEILPGLLREIREYSKLKEPSSCRQCSCISRLASRKRREKLEQLHPGQALLRSLDRKLSERLLEKSRSCRTSDQPSCITSSREESIQVGDAGGESKAG